MKITQRNKTKNKKLEKRLTQTRNLCYYTDSAFAKSLALTPPSTGPPSTKLKQLKVF